MIIEYWESGKVVMVIPATSRKQPYVLALMGAILALCSFYFLPSLSVQVSIHLFGFSADRTRSYMSTELTSSYDQLWYCSLAAFMVLLLALFQLTASQSTTISRLSSYLLMMAGGSGIFVLFQVFTQIYQRPLETLPDFSGVAGLSSSSSFSFLLGSGQAAINLGPGAWCYLAGMLIIIISGALTLFQHP